MRELIVIGNGFDIVHHLPTKYSNFMNYLWSTDKAFYEQLTRYICEDDLWNDFETALGELDDGEVKEMSQAVYLHYNEFQDDYRQVMQKELEFSFKISEQLHKWIDSIDTGGRPILTSYILNNNNIFLNFNYTDTLEKVYGISEKNIVYIHGKASRDEELVLGHHNTYAYAGKEPVCLTFKEMDEWFEFQMNKGIEEKEYDFQVEKYYNVTYKDTDGNIARHISFFESMRDISKIYILGHSLSETDFAYFIKIHSIVPAECIWNITYYSKRDKRNIESMARKIGIKNVNLSKMEKYYI